MVFGTPISWFINEVIAVVLFCIVTVHILKGKDPVHRLLELFFYMLTAGIFENIGVWQHIYDYSTCRIMMFGKVPIAILLVEGVILYATVELMEKVHVPGWVLPFGCGVLSSVQDMTLDPASVFDLHEIEGELEGQWNWTAHYEGGFVDIPFFNFSGWLTMMLFFHGILHDRKKRLPEKEKGMDRLCLPGFCHAWHADSAVQRQYVPSVHGAPFPHVSENAGTDYAGSEFCRLHLPGAEVFQIRHSLRCRPGPADVLDACLPAYLRHGQHPCAGDHQGNPSLRGCGDPARRVPVLCVQENQSGGAGNRRGCVKTQRKPAIFCEGTVNFSHFDRLRWTIEPK